MGREWGRCWCDGGGGGVRCWCESVRVYISPSIMLYPPYIIDAA